MARLQTAVHAAIVLLSLGAGFSALFARPAQSAVVFNNYNGVNCICGLSGPNFFAAGFTPTADYDFSGASALVQNFNFDAQSFSMFLYSSTALGAPSTSLWTTSASAPGQHYSSGSIITVSYSGPTILLQSGQEYFFALQLPSILWLPQGPNSVPFYASDDGGSSWVSLGSSTDQFQIFGHPVDSVASVPEPATWAMIVLGFVGLGFAANRQARQQAARRYPRFC